MENLTVPIGDGGEDGKLLNKIVHEPNREDNWMQIMTCSPEELAKQQETELRKYVTEDKYGPDYIHIINTALSAPATYFSKFIRDDELWHTLGR
jgi:hypothetical protein